MARSPPSPTWAFSSSTSTTGSPAKTLRDLSGPDHPQFGTGPRPQDRPRPTRTPLRSFAGAVVFEDPLPCGFSVAYLLSDAEQYIAVVRLRRTFP